ncbi:MULTISPECIES: chemotaxis protein CheB [unclassified Flavobacterium]|jgi:two-component system chemotaxis response regulator CheB|uniref:chemotaxis protein CheB n=1 Tax=unclassified Flavobacterium TaxID=196869 RepID=UPI0007106213|nr:MULTISPECIES: chemotaxis protein CheB [unclassified Flavobacterium]KRD58014.1 chemotaxis protein CheB [Flavobacterium sp. Root935]MDQ1165367.1 two-component system chemotaxis response regulator CheB [Flavobacterium sp. SORGH_AS_0622]TDX10662.1 CheB methylesterase [Flavobacterium sp. S87F.05.LMB.W.Kidney.N]BDU25992.1 putative chemotaxis protein-glutamate methylesterase [Flavobacterium sp. GSB-24]
MEENKIINHYKVVIIGGSAGSLQALLQILPFIEDSISFALVIVVHRKSTDEQTLEDLIALRSKIKVKEVEDKVKLRTGFIYIAPSNYHLLFEKDETLSLDTSEKINYSRPSIDVSFESAAEIYGPDLIGILLSGSNSDGTVGLKAIQAAGGKIVIQNPLSADMPFMPNNAILHTTPDFVLSTEEILEFIKQINKL